MDKATKEKIFKGVDFETELVPNVVFYGGRDVEIPRTFAVMDKTNGIGIATVKSYYKHVQHKDVITRLYDVMSNFSSDVQVSNRFQAGMVISKMICKDKEILKNVKNEGTLFGIQAFMDYTGNVKLKIAGMLLRVVCTNGMTAPIATQSAAFKHTQNLNLENLYNRISDVMEFYCLGYENLYKGLSKVEPIEADVIERAVNKKVVKLLPDAYNEEFKSTNKHNAWTQFQAITRVITHKMDDSQETYKTDLQFKAVNLFVNTFQIAV